MPRHALRLALVLLAAAGCRPRVEAPQVVLLVSIDTLRHDHLGCYGYPLATSPAIDAFRRDAVLFREVVAQAPSTLPSHASMLSSLVPQHHGATYADRVPMAAAVVTLAEVLRDQGLNTMAWTGGGQLDPVFGLDQGFESYAMPPGSQDFDTVVQPALEWLDRNRDARAFLFLHTYEVHHPYPEPDPALSPEVAAYQGPLQGGIQVGLLQDINRGRLQVDDQDRRRIVLAYDTGIRQMDQAFAALVDGLRRLGLYDRSLIVVTSDHGEELGEHGKMGWHSHTLYDELLLVPLLVKLPRGAHAGLEVKAPVRSIDIAPTILDALAIAAPDDFEGTSLLAWLDRPSRAGLPAIAKQDYPAPRVIEAYRARPWKLYDERLFQLDRDPGERVNLTGQEPDRVRELAQALSDFVAQREPPPAGEVTVGADTEEQLRALGYVQ